jgi:hypothetical protein
MTGRELKKLIERIPDENEVTFVASTIIMQGGLEINNITYSTSTEFIIGIGGLEVYL